MGIITWLTNKSTAIFARGIAKAQLNTLRHLQHQKPELTGESLYEQVIILRPFYNSQKAKKVIREARESFERMAWLRKLSKSEHSVFGFRDVVSALIREEYFKDKLVTRNDATALTIIEITVREIIPADF